MKNFYFKFLQICLLYIISLTISHAELTIDVSKNIDRSGIPITIMSPFKGQAPEEIAEIIISDLEHTGKFKLQSPVTPEYVVIGQTIHGGKNGWIVQFTLTNTQNIQLLDAAFDVTDGQLRTVAHHISDMIYQKLTGELGLSSTKIAFISNNSNSWNLIISDVDGNNPKVILHSKQPIMSPSWSPNGAYLAYVSFENRHSQIVIQEISTGVRRVISDVPGINGAPSWSPDNQQLALTLSKDGNPEIYALDINTQASVRLTNSSAIDTEPVWLPDGSIVFTSDRGGSPQLYKISPGGGIAQRLTIEGDYNARPAVSPDGNYIAMVHREAGRFGIAIMNIKNYQLQVLTSGGADESPSFAPNSKMIIYSHGNGLSTVSIDGRIKQNLALPIRVRDPVWAPRYVLN